MWPLERLVLERLQRDYTSLGCSPTHLAVPLIPRHAGGGGEAAVEAPWWAAAVEWWIAETGDVGARAAAAAEWGDQVSMPRGDLVIPGHAGGGDGGRQAEVEKRLEWLTQSAGGAEERLWRLSELGGELTGGHEDALRAASVEYQFGFGGLGVVGCAYELSETGAEMDAMRLRLIGEIEARHGARIEVLADAITGERMHVLDLRLGGWAARMYGWAAEELAGRRLPASPEQLEEEERDNAYDKAGFLSFMEFGGFDLGQAGY